MTRCRDETGRSASWAANCQVSEARIDFFGSQTHTVDSVPAHPTEPGLEEDSHDSIPVHSHDGGTGCAGGFAKCTQSPSLLLETSHTRPTWLYGTMAHHHGHPPRMLGLPQLPCGPLATLTIWQRSTPCSGALIAACRIPYSRTSSALVAFLSTEEYDHQQHMRLRTITGTMLLREIVHAAKPQRSAVCGVVYDRTRGRADGQKTCLFLNPDA